MTAKNDKANTNAKKANSKAKVAKTNTTSRSTKSTKTAPNKKVVVVKKADQKNKKKKIVKKKKININGEIKKVNSKLLLLVTFFSGVIFIIATYAWLSVSLNVKIKSLNLVVSSDSGLFISLDGINFSDSVEISNETVIDDLKDTYPTNTNQWASGGLWPVSTAGIPNSSQSKFSMYMGEVSRFKDKVTNRRYLNTSALTENGSSSANSYIAFDVFLKNVSGSPYNDNLYLDDGTSVKFEDGITDDDKNAMEGVLDSIRFGFVKVGSVPVKSATNVIQGIDCNNACQMVIYEPNSTDHSDQSIEKAKEYGVDLVNGKYTPSYAIISEGRHLEYANGQEGTGIELDTAHFALQKTITSFANPIFTLPNAITKLRVYIWIEGQDIDSLETNSRGANIYISINFVKDLAGYE